MAGARGAFLRSIRPLALLLAVLMPSQGLGSNILIIGAGLQRTGHQSLVQALQLLGFRVFHNFHYAASRTMHKRWNNFLVDGKSLEPALRKVMDDGFNATLDYPAYLAWYPLAGRFPDAKVILTVRDSPEEWYDSLVANLPQLPSYWIARRFVRRFLLDVTPEQEARLEKAGRTGAVATGDSSCDLSKDFHSPEARNRCIRAYERHIEKVQRTVQKARLLVFNVKEGWAPLCRFLALKDEPCPPEKDMPFPHSTQSDQVSMLLSIIPLVVLVWGSCCCCWFLGNCGCSCKPLPTKPPACGITVGEPCSAEHCKED